MNCNVSELTTRHHHLSPLHPSPLASFQNMADRQLRYIIRIVQTKNCFFSIKDEFETTEME